VPVGDGVASATGRCQLLLERVAAVLGVSVEYLRAGRATGAEKYPGAVEPDNAFVPLCVTEPTRSRSGRYSPL
jgi:hypothetical protein